MVQNKDFVSKSVTSSPGGVHVETKHIGCMLPFTYSCLLRDLLHRFHEILVTIKRSQNWLASYQTNVKDQQNKQDCRSHIQESHNINLAKIFTAEIEIKMTN